MARKKRDYKAEEQRRNAKAREAGFSSRAQERNIRNKSAKWSREHAKEPVAFYQKKWSAARVRAYYDAFASKTTGFHTFTKTYRGDEASRHWLVDVTHYMTADEYEEKYHLRV